MENQAYHLQMPQSRLTPVIFSSPHSGREYSARFLQKTRLNLRELRASEDAFVDDLFGFAGELGAPLLRAQAPRCYVDLNRGADELDPALIKGVVRSHLNPRVAGGLGVIPRIVSASRPIYVGKLTLEEVNARLGGYWLPYHGQLGGLIEQSRALFGQAIILDCHSMPSVALQRLAHVDQGVPDVILGDRYGSSASQEVIGVIESALQSVGLRVLRNVLFSGAYIAQRYGRPSQNVHAVQIEVNRALYLNEDTIECHEGFRALQQTLHRAMTLVCAEFGGNNINLAAQ